MQVLLLHEAGYNEALFGMSLSFGVTSGEMLLPTSPTNAFVPHPSAKQDAVALRLAPKDGGHNKFLESIVVWLWINAPRYWWQEFDTYRVGTSKQSESTIHTIVKKQLSAADFAEGEVMEGTLVALNSCVMEGDMLRLKRLLPEGYLQGRVVSTNYKVLRHILKQRMHHRLPEWHTFCQQVVNGVDHPELLPELTGGSYERCTQ